MLHLYRIKPVMMLGVCALLASCGGDGPATQVEQDAGVPDSGKEDASTEIIAVDAGPSVLGDAGEDASAPQDAGYDAGDAGPGGTFYNVTLATAAESPVCAGAGPLATGLATVWTDATEQWISVMLSYENLSSAPTMAHIHFGAANTNGPVVFSLGSDLGSPIHRSLNASNYYAAQGAPPSFAAFVTELKAGKAYLNLHTTACPDGEIRSQIQ